MSKYLLIVLALIFNSLAAKNFETNIGLLLLIEIKLSLILLYTQIAVVSFFYFFMYELVILYPNKLIHN